MRLLALSILSLLVLAVPGVEATVASTCTGQVWYVGGDDTLTIYRNTVPPPDDPDFPYAIVADAETRTWYANEPSQIEINFGSGEFAWSLDLANGFNGDYEILVGHGNPSTGSFTPAGTTGVLSGDGSSTIITGSIGAENFVIPQGSHLAFQIHNHADSAANPRSMRIVMGSPDSYVCSHAGDPGYPTPELATLVLAASGLGLIVFGRRLLK